jgi:hypothetical protein
MMVHGRSPASVRASCTGNRSLGYARHAWALGVQVIAVDAGLYLAGSLIAGPVIAGPLVTIELGC